MPRVLWWSTRDEAVGCEVGGIGFWDLGPVGTKALGCEIYCYWLLL